MPWSIFAALGGRYTPYAEQGEETEVLGEGTDGDDAGLRDDGACMKSMDLPLDPVTVASQLLIFEVLKNAIALSIIFGRVAIERISDITKFEKEVLCCDGPPSTQKERPITAPKWKKHISSLVDFKVLFAIPFGLVRFVATYFAVVKNDDAGRPVSARTIFNGGRMTKEATTPRSTHLPDFRVLLLAVGQLFAENIKKKIYVVEGDIRHWFHQIHLATRVSAYFV